MKRFASIILATAVAASVFAGCNSNKITDSTTASTIPTESSAATSATFETTAPAETVAWEPQSFEELYGEQLMNYLGHQYYFDGQPVPVEESNFYFINAFFDLSGYANMGYYPSTTLGYIDLAAEYSGTGYETYGDYFVKYAENSLFTSLVLNARAAEKKMSLSDDTKSAIDDMMEDLRTGKAANSDMTLDEYLQFYYGPGNDEVHFRSVLERYYLADAYSAIYCSEYEFEDSVKYVPYVRYALFYAPESSDQATIDSALEQANQMKDACTKIDDLSDLAAAAKEKGLISDQGDIAVPKGQTVSKFEEWAYGANRKEGEIDIIYAPEYGYFVVGYLGLQSRSADELNQIALSNLSQSVKDEMANGTHNFHTDEEFQSAPAGPTPTTAVDIAPSEEGSGAITAESTSGSDPATPSVPVKKELSTTDVLVVVFITLAAVAIAAVVIILIASAMKNSKGGSNSGKAAPKKSDSKETKKAALSQKKENKSGNSSKKKDEDEDEDKDKGEDVEESEESDEPDDSDDEDEDDE